MSIKHYFHNILPLLCFLIKEPPWPVRHGGFSVIRLAAAASLRTAFPLLQECRQVSYDWKAQHQNIQNGCIGIHLSSDPVEYRITDGGQQQPKQQQQSH